MNRTKKFLYNSFTTAIYQLVVMCVGFIVPKIMLSTYGSEINGLVTSITQFITYFNLVEAGLAGASVYALYKPLANDDYDEVNGIVSASKKFYLQAGYIFVTLVVILSIIYPFFVKSEKLNFIEIFFLVLVLGANGTLEFFTLAKYRVLLTADQKTYVISIASIIYTILNTIIIVVLAHFNINIVLLRFVSIFSILIRSLILYIYVNNKYKYINYNAKPKFKALDKRWDALFLQILGAINTGAPVVLATIFTNLKSVSIYSIFNMIIGAVNSVLSIFISGLSASFGDLIARNEIKTLQKSYKEFEFTYYSMITFVYSVSFILIMPFIKIYTKGIVDTNYNQPLIGFLFVLNGLLYNIKTPQGMLVISAGMYKETKKQTITQGTITVVGGAILGYFLGLKGILIGSILSNLYRDIDLLSFIPKNVTKLSVSSTFFRIVRIIISILLINLPFYFYKMQINNYLSWILSAIVISIYACFIILIMSLLFDIEEFKNVIKRLKFMISR